MITSTAWSCGLNGSFVAGYELKGLTSYFATDEGRNRGKLMIEALLRSIPEQSMRVQFRYEVVEDLGGLVNHYVSNLRSTHLETCELDELRVERWKAKETASHYRRPLLHVYFIWDPVLHRRIVGKPLKPSGDVFSLSARKCIERTRREHQDLLAEFESLLQGVETALQAADLGARRLDDDDLFIEAKRALNPLRSDQLPYRREGHLEFRSAREQIADVSILDETDNYLNVDGILFTFVSLKELPDATFPGTLRELTALDFPVIVNAQLTIPDQAKVLKSLQEPFAQDAGRTAGLAWRLKGKRRGPGRRGAVVQGPAGHHFQLRKDGAPEPRHRGANVTTCCDNFRTGTGGAHD